MNINIKKAFALLMASLLSVFATSCKDERTLDGAGDEIYITMTPRFPNLDLKVGGDTINMSCIVKNHAGEVIPTEVKWSTDKPELAKFIEGTNKLVAIAEGASPTVMVRATLPNGRYAITKANISSWRAEKLELLASPTINESGEGKDKKYSANFEFLKDELVLNPGEVVTFLVRSTPAQMLEQTKLVFDGVDESLFEIEELKLDLNTINGQKKAAVTPKGVKWFLLKVKDNARFVNHKVTIKLAGEKTKVEKSFVVTSGTVLKELAFLVLNPETKDKPENERTYLKMTSASKIVDLKGKGEVRVFVDYSPSLAEDLENVKKDLKFEIVDANGGGCILDEVTYDEKKKCFVAKFSAGATAGKATLKCSYQGKDIQCTIAVVDLKNIEYTGLEVTDKTKNLFADLYVGETIPLRVKILPKKSTAFLQGELKYTVANPDLIQISGSGGNYSVTGVKAGSTEIVFTLRGKELRLPITAKAAVKALSIDNKTPNILMLGDQVEWRADVAMYGTDTPDYSKLLWKLADTKLASFIGKSTGEVVTLKANKLAEGQEVSKVSVTASYRGQSGSRELTIVPLQANAIIKSDNLNLDDAGVTVESGKIKILLTPKKSAKAKENLELQIESKDGQAIKLEAKTYTAKDYNIYIIWNNALGVKKLALDPSSIKVEKANKQYNFALDLMTKAGDKEITVKGAAKNLEKY